MPHSDHFRSDDPRLQAHMAGVPLTWLCEFCPDTGDLLDVSSAWVVSYKCRTCNRVAFVGLNANNGSSR